MSNKRILDAIKSPADLKLLSNDELTILAGEIRKEIVDVTSKTGGHVASSLGAVEIILALHAELNCPSDKLVFDVGHQAYAHKLVTGRLKQFKTLRQQDGISGFPKPTESPYDVHFSGHASDSLSVAYGLACARDLRGSNEKVVALIGDAALSGGMAFEALNNIGQAQTPMVIVLNDNEMSISHNVGALMRHLGDMRVSTQYRTTRDNMQEYLETSLPFGRAITNLGRNVKESVKQFIIPHSMMFEQLNIVCTMPIDGHNIALLRDMFRIVLQAEGPVLVHVVTKKGKGYAPAEKNPTLFHGVGPYSAKTGKVKQAKNKAPKKYTEVFGEALVSEAKRNSKILAITAAMASGTGLCEFAEKYPNRFYDTGISEEHAVAMAAGLAKGGMKPVVAMYSTFLQRAIDQLIIDVCLPKLDVVFAIDRAGIVGADGATHNGAFDLAYLRMVPNLRILTPSSAAELVCALHTALSLKGPVAIRYPRGTSASAEIPVKPATFEVGKANVLCDGTNVAILAFGNMVEQALVAKNILEQKNISTRVVDMRWAKPLDVSEIKRAANTKLVVTLESGAVCAGVGQEISSILASEGSQAQVLNLGIPDKFVIHGNTETIYKQLGLDGESIANTVLKTLK